MGFQETQERQKIYELQKRIEELETELREAAKAITQIYGGLPKDQFPGPPTSLAERMLAMANRKWQ